MSICGQAELHQCRGAIDCDVDELEGAAVRCFDYPVALGWSEFSREAPQRVDSPVLDAAAGSDGDRVDRCDAVEVMGCSRPQGFVFGAVDPVAFTEGLFFAELVVNVEDLSDGGALAAAVKAPSDQNVVWRESS